MISGIINIDKISGFSSFWHDAFIKRVIGVKKVGHTGTLDPIATGLLTICIGKATRLVKYLSGDKIYIAEALWGVQTDTDDITGNALFHSDNPTVDEKAVENIIQGFIGKISQTPPAYSAIKVKGRPLYDYARGGQKIDIPTRVVQIYDIKLIEHHKRRSQLQIHCSKGTYIRSIIRDMGKMLGCYGTILSLRRVASDHFNITDAYTIGRIYDKSRNDGISSAIIPMIKAVSFLPTISVKGKEETCIKNGAALTGEFPYGQISIVNADGNLIAIGDGSGTVIKPETVFD